MKNVINVREKQSSQAWAGIGCERVIVTVESTTLVW